LEKVLMALLWGPLNCSGTRQPVKILSETPSLIPHTKALKKHAFGPENKEIKEINLGKRNTSWSNMR
jgi:hypothetical protein